MADEQSAPDNLKPCLSIRAAGTLRTRRNADFPEQDMTALDLAYELEATYLYELLAPVIYSPVPMNVLSNLERQLHQLIRSDLGDLVDKEKLFLPKLEVLTELRLEYLWFPIRRREMGVVRLP